MRRNSSERPRGISAGESPAPRAPRATRVTEAGSAGQRRGRTNGPETLLPRLRGASAAVTALLAAAGVCILLAGCATTQAYEREALADVIMERQNPFSKQTLEQKFFTTREGSIGGSAGIGGGCGCAK